MKQKKFSTAEASKVFSAFSDNRTAFPNPVCGNEPLDKRKSSLSDRLDYLQRDICSIGEALLEVSTSEKSPLTRRKIRMTEEERKELRDKAHLLGILQNGLIDVMDYVDTIEDEKTLSELEKMFEQAVPNIVDVIVASDTYEGSMRIKYYLNAKQPAQAQEAQ